MFNLYCLTILAITLLIILCYTEKDKKETFFNSPYSGLTNNSDTPWTIDRPTKAIVTTVLTKIMNMINKKTTMAYVVNGYDILDQKNSIN